MAVNFTLSQKVKIISGAGCVAQIGDVLKDGGYKKPFVLYDKGLKAAGVAEKIVDLIKLSGAEVVEYDGVLPNPPDTMVEEAAEICKANNCDCVVAIGGGSAIDTGHGVTVLRFNPGRILDYAKPDAQMCYCPGLISVPTTSGTGAELSNGIIISNAETDEKVPIVGYNAMSEYAILDPELTVGMPKGLTAMTGLDVFSHAYEAYTTVLTNPVVGPICEKVMQEVVENLPIAMEDPSNLEARERMHVASALGGWMLANCCAHVGHSIAHVIGGKFHIPHGAACAYACATSMKFIAPVVPNKIKKVGEILGAEFDGTETPEQIAEKTAVKYEKFRDEIIGLKPISEYGIKLEDALAVAPAIEAEVFAPLTPRQVTEEDAKAMLKEIFA